MAIVEFRGGPVTHRSLMNKSKYDLAHLYMELLGVYEKERALLDFIKHEGISLQCFEFNEPSDGAAKISWSAMSHRLRHPQWTTLAVADNPYKAITGARDALKKMQPKSEASA